MLVTRLFNPVQWETLQTRLSNEAPGNVAPILPIEAAVTGGRSYFEARRTGWLGLQDRLSQELATAAVWLFGVGFFAKAADKLLEKMNRKPRYLDADWSKDFFRSFFRGKAPSLHLSPMELFSNHANTLWHTLWMKGAKLAVAVSVPLALCGFIIPRLNQWKTYWLIKHVSQWFAKPPGVIYQSRAPLPTNDNRGAAAMPIASTPYTPYSYPKQAAALRFGLSPVNWESLLSQTGHLINNTTYGQVLVVDAAITGGNAQTAARRSPYESFEFVFRDLASLVFYLKSVPFIMTHLGGVVGKQVGTEVGLDHQVVRQIHEHLLTQFKPGIGVNPAQWETVLEGALPGQLADILKPLVPAMRHANTEAFLDHLALELNAYCKTPTERQHAQTGLMQTRRYVNQTLGAPATLTQQHMQTLLEDVLNHRQQFAPLAKDGKNLTFHLSTALKLAFHHQAGAPGTMFTQLEAPAALKTSFARVAQRDGDKIAASIMRRALNAALLAHDTTAKTAPTWEKLKHMEALVRLAERATIQDMPLETFARDHLRHVVDAYDYYLAKGGPAVPALKRLHKTISDQLKNEAGVLNKKTLLDFAHELDRNGRSDNAFLRRFQGFGLKHLGADIRLIADVLPEHGAVAHQGFLTRHLDTTLAQLIDGLPQTGLTSQKPLLTRYQTMLSNLRAQGGRVLLLGDDSLHHHFSTGLRYNDALVNMALRTLNRTPLQREAYFEVSRKEAMQQSINHYLGLVEARMTQALKATGKTTLSQTEFSRLVLSPMLHTHGWARFCVYSVAVVTSMLGVGVLIPTIQNAMTKTLTGQNIHPGLAAVSKKLHYALPGNA